MENYYKILGVSPKASPDDIRRAYRILARRYHPDVNPGRASEEKFKSIAAAYSVLGDDRKRKSYDSELQRAARQQNQQAKQASQSQRNEAAFNAYRQYEEQYSARRRSYDSRRREAKRSTTSNRERQLRKPDNSFLSSSLRALSVLSKRVTQSLFGRETAADPSLPSLAIVEVVVTMHEAINGGKKTVEITNTTPKKKISVTIPQGTKTGSVIRMRSKGSFEEEMVLVVRVAAHPFLSLQPKGLVAEIPITINEAISGASITVPTLDEPAVVKIPPGTQSGYEIRLKERGAPLREGGRGDLFLRMLIRIPDATGAVGFREKAQEIEQYYEESVRRHLRTTLLE